MALWTFCKLIVLGRDPLSIFFFEPCFGVARDHRTMGSSFFLLWIGVNGSPVVSSTAFFISVNDPVSR